MDKALSGIRIIDMTRRAARMTTSSSMRSRRCGRRWRRCWDSRSARESVGHWYRQARRDNQCGINTLSLAHHQVYFLLWQ